MNVRDRAARWLVLLVPCAAFFVWVGQAGGAGGLNPADPGLPVVDNVFGRNGVPGNAGSAMCVSCHSTVPVSARSSHFTSHYSSQGGTLRRTNNAAAKERVTQWTGSGWNSKYGQNLGTAPASDNAAGDLICESCHNVLHNVPGGNNLLESSMIGDGRPGSGNTLGSPTTTLCEGCHVSGNLPGHHPMTGDVLSDGTTLSSASDTAFTRAFTDNVSDAGPSGMIVPPGSDVRYPGVNRLPCISCHGNGHSGFSGTGARLLRRGYAGPGTPSPPGPGAGVSGSDVTGVDRQYDFDTSGATRLIGNYTPLCDACHKADD